MQDLTFVGRKLTKRKPDSDVSFESRVLFNGLPKSPKLDVEQKNTQFGKNNGQRDYLLPDPNYHHKGMNQSGALLGFDSAEMIAKIESCLSMDLKGDNLKLGKDSHNRNANRDCQAIQFDKFIDLSRFTIETIITKYQEQNFCKYW